jgi:hypothetical protein
MGYRSEVMMMLKGPALKEVKVLMDTAGIDLNEHWGETFYGNDKGEGVKVPSCFGYGRDHNDQLTFVFHTDDVKWYESFPEVQAIEKMWEFASMIGDKESNNVSYLDETITGIFIRIGEDYEDVMVKAIGINGYELAQVQRTIDFDHQFLGEQIDWSAEINRDRIEAAKAKMKERKCA